MGSGDGGVGDKDKTWLAGGIPWDGRFGLVIRMMMMFMIVSE